MDQPIKKNIPDPMTVGHGRKLFEQSKEIAAQLEKLQPLLALIEVTETAPQHDPISVIVQLLTEICKEQQVQRKQQQALHRKLDFLIENLSGDAPFTASAK